MFCEYIYIYIYFYPSWLSFNYGKCRLQTQEKIKGSTGKMSPRKMAIAITPLLSHRTWRSRLNPHMSLLSMASSLQLTNLPWEILSQDLTFHFFMETMNTKSVDEKSFLRDFEPRPNTAFIFYGDDGNVKSIDWEICCSSRCGWQWRQCLSGNGIATGVKLETCTCLFNYEKDLECLFIYIYHLCNACTRLNE